MRERESNREECPSLRRSARSKRRWRRPAQAREYELGAGVQLGLFPFNCREKTRTKWREREREGGIFTEYFLIIPKSEVREREGKESRKTQIKSKTRHEHCEGLSLSHTHIHSRYSSLC